MFPFAFNMGQVRHFGILTLATLILHLVALSWADQQLSRPAPSSLPRPAEAVQIRLRPAQVTPARLTKPVSTVQNTRDTKPAPRVPQKKVAAPTPAITPDISPASETSTLSQAENPPTLHTASTEPEPALPAAAAPAEPQAETPAATTAGLAEPAAPAPPPPGKAQVLRIPPSMELKYKVRKANSLDDDTSLTEGSGTIRWQNLGSQYKIHTEAKILFFTLLSAHSEGDITDSGIAPLIYTVKKPKATTNTHFQRGKNVISFSASTREYPRTAGAQDQSSMIFQLAAVGLGNSEQIDNDRIIEFVVASEREAEPWQFRVIGLNEKKYGDRIITSWHLQRIPPAGSFTKKFDIWLSPEHHWAPIHILQTDSKGGIIEMIMSQITLTESEQK